MDLATYIAERTDRSGGPDACWPWLLSTGSHGYGQAWNGGTVTLAHRLVWLVEHGPIPEGMTVDHLCFVRPCCNPKHLRLLSNIENARNNGMARRTHCPKQHPYNETNTYRSPKGDRRCRACARERVTA